MKAGINPAKTWFVVRTNIKCEAKAAENIRQAGFDCYCPTMRVERWNKRTNTYRESERPLMLRYLFVGLDPKHKHFGFVRACEGVECLLEVQGEPVPVAAKAIEGIYLAEIDMQFDDTRKARKHRDGSIDRQFPIGMAVMVRKFIETLRGEVVETNNHKDRVKVSFGSLGATWVRPEDIEAA